MSNNAKTIYTAEATATGGRMGQIKSSDGVLDMPVGMPGAPGSENKTNPEQLFAAGYAACFQGAMMVVARMQNEQLPDDCTVTAQVDLNKFENHSYGLGVRLKVDLKGMDKEKGQKLVEEAHKICPYSAGISGNIKVDLEVV